MKFIKAELSEIPADKVLEYAYKRFNNQRALTAVQAGEITLDDRVGNGKCPDCNEDEWFITPLFPMIKEGGKSYIECTHCGYVTHL